MKTSSILTIAFTLACLGPAAAMAEQVSVRVPYADLNLASESGRATLDRRIAAATREICGAPELERDLSRQMAIRTCAKDVQTSIDPVRIALMARHHPGQS